MKLKKLVALVLVAVMMMAMGTMTAFAEESYPITITNDNATADHTYTAYQVFSGTLSTNESGEKVLANIGWGNGVDGAALLIDLKKNEAYSACTDAASVAEVLTGFTDNSAQMEAFAEIVGKHLTTGTASTASADHKTYTIDPKAPGYYIIKETGTNPETTRSASGFMIEVVGPAEATVKDNDMTPDKNILQNGETKVKEDTANVGDDVQFVVDQTKVPSTDGYKTFKFVMKDTLPKGLTFKQVDSVKLGSTTLTTADYEVKTTTDATTGKTELRIVFKDALNLLKPYEGQTVEIKYTATVNKDAEFGNTGNKNEVVFEFTNNPDDEHEGDDFGPDEPHGTSPKSETTTYVTKIVVKKVDDKDKALGGAVFKLSGSAKNVVVTTGQHFVADSTGTYYKLKDGTYTTTAPTDNTADKYESTTQKYKLESYESTALEGADNVDIEAVSDATTGEITFAGLKPGEYTLTETGAPVGYNKITEPITFKIKFDSETKKFAFDGTAPAGVTLESDGTFKIEVENKAGSTLPSTGGMGTRIFYALGSILVIGAGIILVSRKRAGK